MRNPIILLALGIVILSCQSDQINDVKSEEEKPVLLSGKITNLKGDSLVIKGPKEITHTAYLDEDGNFSLSFPVARSAPYILYYGGEFGRVFFSPGDSMSLALDTERFDETLIFTGKGAGKNNYIVRLLLMEEQVEKELPNEILYSMSTTDYLLKADSIHQLRKNFLKRSSSKENLGEDFVRMEEKHLYYSKGLEILHYKAYLKHYTDIKEVNVPNDFYSSIDNYNINEPEMFDDVNYQQFVIGFIHRKAKEIFDDLSEEKKLKDFALDVIWMECLVKEIQDEDLRNAFLQDKVMRSIKRNGMDDISEILLAYRKLCTDQELINSVDGEIAYWQKMEKGNPAFAFTYPDINGEIVSLNDFKGKAVYIDVWATWCGPCRKEIPFLDKLEKLLHEENVAFISVSVDEDREKWERMVNEDQMGGIQLLADKDWDSSICKDYKITGIPRFILIDTEGNIVDANAPRPSSGDELIALIREAMEVDLTMK